MRYSANEILRKLSHYLVQYQELGTVDKNSSNEVLRSKVYIEGQLKRYKVAYDNLGVDSLHRVEFLLSGIPQTMYLVGLDKADILFIISREYKDLKDLKITPVETRKLLRK